MPLPVTRDVEGGARWTGVCRSSRERPIPSSPRQIMGELEAPLGRADVGLWRNGETRVKLEENVRGSDVFAIQSMSTPVDHHLMELLLIIDALRRASAARITAVIPVFRLRQAREEDVRPRADLGQARRQSPHHRRRRPHPDDGSALAGHRGVL